MTSKRLISVSNGILDPRHVEKIRGALWLFLYLIDKVTAEENGVGSVLRGKPVTDEEISRCGLDRRSIIRYRKTLVQGGYITAKRAPHGYIYTVENSKKFSYTNGHRTGPKPKPEPVSEWDDEGYTKEEMDKMQAESEVSGV